MAKVVVWRLSLSPLVLSGERNGEWYEARAARDGAMIGRVLILIVLPFWMAIWIVEGALFGALLGAATAWEEWRQVWKEKGPALHTPALSRPGARAVSAEAAPGPQGSEDFVTRRNGEIRTGLRIE
jgi:hypothetical protein